MIQLTRRYRFPAAHVLSNPMLSEAENDTIFGKCANPNGHGHNYEIEVTVTGPIHHERGQIVPPERLDVIFERTIQERYGWKLLNRCEAFSSLVPTSENLARVVYDELAPAIKSETGAELVRVRLTETPRNFFEYGEPL